jgi:hypothetical protein
MENEPVEKDTYRRSMPSRGSTRQRIVLNFKKLVPPLFSIVLESIYTGRVATSENLVAGVMRLATQLGVEFIREACANHIICNLSSETMDVALELGTELKCTEITTAVAQLRARELRWSSAAAGDERSESPSSSGVSERPGD